MQFTLAIPLGEIGKRGALFDEALVVMRLAWQGGPVTWERSSFAASGNEPRPIPEPQPKVWIGGGSDKTIARAARHGDGWSPFFAAPTQSKLNRDTGIHSFEELSGKVEQLKALRAELARINEFDISIGPRVRLRDCNRSEAERYLDALNPLSAAAVTWVMTELPHPSRQAYLENVQWFGKEVIARTAAR